MRSTEQSAGIKVGGFCPDIYKIGKWIPKKLELITRSSSTGSAGRTEGEKRNWTEQYYFFDIDGTVLSEITKEVPVSAINAMKAAQQAGHLLFINTGRTICSIPPEIRRLKFDGYLCGCGTYLTYQDEVLFQVQSKKSVGGNPEKATECNLG